MDSDEVAWLEQARWLYTEQRIRYDTLGQQAVALVGFELVVIGLSLQRFPDVGWQVWAASAAMCMFVISIAFSVWGLRPRTLDGINLSALQCDWSKTLEGSTTIKPAAQFVEHLLRGHPSSTAVGTNPVSSLADAASARARCNIGSLVLTAIGALLLVISQVPPGGGPA